MIITEIQSAFLFNQYLWKHILLDIDNVKGTFGLRGSSRSEYNYSSMDNVFQ